ncbi:MAG TPA: isocitrate lyase/PEP mutase family protein [Hyphomicrobiales bacterium]|nr:isocitrate lyase/PEP mutase family protein [Hyphomicrobiales bacterium]
MAGRTSDATAKRRQFRSLLARPEIAVMPGGFSPLLARMVERLGFDAFFIAGSQVSAFLYGLPDNGIIGLGEMATHARHVAAACDIPVLIDGDTGYGNAVNVHFAVEEFVRSGAAGVQFEDQEAPKKSATQAGRRCISTEEAVGKIRAAVAARNALDPEFVICARCDVLGAEGGSFAEALERSIAYVRDGGADFVWLNSVESRDDIARACADIPAPVMTIWGGEGPPPTIPELQALGQRIAFYPVMASVFAAQSAFALLSDFKERGTAMLEEWNQRRDPRANAGALVGLERIRAIEEASLPAALRRDYDTTWGH